MRRAWSRRELLSGLGLATAALVVGGPARSSGAADARARAARLVATLAAPRDAARIGERYLAGEPQAGDRDALVRLLDPECIASRTPMPALRAQLLARQREDFARERVVQLDGWLLSATEVRLYALAARLGG